MDIILHDYWRSSASYRVRIALGLAGLDWRPAPVDLLAGAQKAADNLARNPQGLVPTLEIDGLHFTQSLAIIEYLDETRGLGLLPADAVGRARARALAYAVAMEIHPVCNLSVARHAVAASGEAISMAGWMQHFIAPGLAALEVMLEHPATGRFCHGDRIGLADLCLIPQVYNAARWGVPTDHLPRITAIMAAAAEVPAVAAAHPDNFQPKG